MPPRVLFVSKPIAPPFHDGTKCLVRDVALSLRRVEPQVMSAEGAPALEAAAPLLADPNAAPVKLAPVYPGSGQFAPSLSDNLRAAAWLLARSRADVWHFVFAPNPRSSAAGRALSRLRRVPVVQTIASPPREFSHAPRILFGNVVVAQSRWTRQNVNDAFVRANVPQARRPRLEVIPPPVGPLRARSAEAQLALRQKLSIRETAPVFVYPGDLETSTGAEAVAASVEPIVRELPEAVVVFAYRAKSPAAPLIARGLERRLGDAHARFCSELPDVLTLVQTARAVLFPVDDLWGKVDLPIVLLEAMQLGVPVVALDHGPLRDLEGVVKIAPRDPAALVGAAVRLEREADWRASVVEAQARAVHERYRAAAVAARYEDLYLELADAR